MNRTGEAKLFAVAIAQSVARVVLVQRLVLPVYHHDITEGLEATLDGLRQGDLRREFGGLGNSAQVAINPVEVTSQKGQSSGTR